MVFAHGGLAILLRSLYCTIIVYLLAIGTKNLVDPDRSFEWTWAGLRQLQKDFVATATWFGAMYAGIYAALYARFSSQWTYLAELYNQIKEVECLTPAPDEANRKAMVQWKAAFIEDCTTLHLDKKPMFAFVIAHWLHDDRIDREFREGVHQGAAKLARLRKDLAKVLGRSASRSSGYAN